MNNQEVVHGVSGLKKYDMEVSSVVFIVYCCVAAGAFGIEEMVASSGPSITIIMLLVFPVVWALPLSLSVAEMGAVIPEEGGSYVWVKKALGEFWGFQMGWWSTAAYYLTNSIYIVLAVGYMGCFIEMTETQAYIIKIALILIFTAINLMGIKEVGRISAIFSILVLLIFGAVTVVGFMNWNYNPMSSGIPEGMSVTTGVGSCIGLCIWMYCGYISMPNLAGEVKDPQVIPKGILICMPLVAATYVLPTVAALASVGDWENWTVAGEGAVGYSTVLTNFLSPAFGTIFLIIAVIAQCSIFNASFAAGSRGFFVLADDNLCPKILTKISKNRGVPYVGILSLTVVTIVLIQFEFIILVMAEVVFILAGQILLCISLLVLRKKIPLQERKGLFIIPGGKIGVCLCSIVPIMICIIAMMISGTDYFLAGLIATATGPIAYIVFKRLYGGLYKEDSNGHPINIKTKLAVGDLTRISIFTCAVGLFALVGSFGLRLYEGNMPLESGFGPEYYIEEYGQGLFSDFNGMLNVLLYGGVIVLIVGILLMIVAKIAEKVPKELDQNTILVKDIV